MKTTAIFTICFAAILALSACKEEKKEEAQAAPVSPYSCTQAQDCLIVEGVCPGDWISVNKTRADELKQRVQTMRSSVECDKGKLEIAKPEAAECIEKRCELGGSATRMSKMPDMNSCLVSEDCEIVEAVCPGWWVAVNKMHKDFQIKEIKRLRPLVRCRPPQGSETKPETAICTEGKCKLPEMKKAP